MSENNISDIQNLLCNFQKAMKAKASTVRGQWNSITCLEKISQVQLCRRLNDFGITATNNDVAQLFYYLGIRKNGLGFTDFISLMETDPSSLGPKTRRFSKIEQSKDLLEHQTLRSYEDDLNKYCRRTANYTPSIQTRASQKNTKKITRPYTAPKSSNNSYQTKTPRKQKNSNRPNIYSNQLDQDYNEDDQYVSREDQPISSNQLEDAVTFTYEPCKSILERSLPRDKSSRQSREATLKTFSNTAIQRQYYDGTDTVHSFNNNDSGMSLRELVTLISDVAYTACKNSKECFLRWRDPHHDLLDAGDLRRGLKKDNKQEISQADAQRVIDKYGGPMTLSTFSVMLHDGSHFNPNKSFGYDDI